MTTLTSLGFFMIGYDNGLFGGFVDGEAFLNSFDHPSPTIIGVIVGIYESRLSLASLLQGNRLTDLPSQLAAFSVR